MYNIYFDSGTTNTRIYLIKNKKVLGSVKKEIGIKDVSISGDKEVLIKGLNSLYKNILKAYSLKDEDIEGIYASGMITCPFGLKEIPHLSTPITLRKLTENIYPYKEDKIFNRKINLIRGAKTITDEYMVDSFNIAKVNNLRGEEIEVYGILSMLGKEAEKEKIAVFLPGSHTHIVLLENGVFADILSTFSGELFYAITSSTVLADSVKTQKNELDRDMVEYGFECLESYGFNRAIYIAHAMKIFDVNNNNKRMSFLEGIISGGIIQAFKKKIKEKWNQIDKVVIAGNNITAQVYSILLETAIREIEVKILDNENKESFAAKGMIEILNEVYKQ